MMFFQAWNGFNNSTTEVNAVQMYDMKKLCMKDPALEPLPPSPPEPQLITSTVLYECDVFIL